MEEYISVFFHHGGNFGSQPRLRYVGGRVDCVKGIEIDTISIPDLISSYKEVGGGDFERIMWLEPGKLLDNGLKDLKTDADIRELSSRMSNGSMLHLYFIHAMVDNAAGHEDVDDYGFTASEEAYIDELIAEGATQEVNKKEIESSNKGKAVVNGEDDDEACAEDDADNDDSSEEEAYIPCHEEESDSSSNDDEEEEYEELQGTSRERSKKTKKKWRLHHTPYQQNTQQSADLPQQTTQTQEAAGTSTQAEDGYLTEEFESLKGSDDDQNERRPAEFNDRAPYGQVHLEIGMLFATLETFKQAVKDYTISLGREVFLKKNDKVRVKYVCEDGCPWNIICSKSEFYGAYRIKTFYPEHSCSRQIRNHNADRKWIASKLIDKLWSTPTLTATQAIKFITEEFQVKVEEMTVYRALRKAKQVVEGSEREQYAKLKAYFSELLTSNEGSTAQIGVERPDLTFPPKFDKCYICFNACKKGLLSGCRPLIGLDGCFLKGYYGGTLLAAVTQDPNNAFYVIAYAVVEQETKDTWTFFLTRLFEDIGNPQTHGWEFISDMQKGLLPAMQELAPGTRHRFCVKHLESNVWKQWRNKELRFKLWACAKSKTVAEFDRNFAQLREINANAWSYLQRFPMETWSRAGISSFSKNPALLNNMCEQFNACIVNFRGKPIYSMLEEIRLYMMRKMNDSRLQIGRHKGPICPFAQRKVDQAKKDSNSWTPLWAGDEETSKYQVHHMHKTQDKYVVHLKEFTCSCREWDLYGIPCVHALAAIGHYKYTPEDYVSDYYSRSTWESIYLPYIKPVRGESQWDKNEEEAIVPPSYNRGGGRPKKRRRKTNDLPPNPYKAKRTYSEMTCGKCGQKGHSRRYCKGTTIKEKPQPKKRKTKQSQGNKTTETENVATGSMGIEVSEPPAIVASGQVMTSPRHASKQSREASEPHAIVASGQVRTSPRQASKQSRTSPRQGTSNVSRAVRTSPRKTTQQNSKGTSSVKNTVRRSPRNATTVPSSQQSAGIQPLPIAASGPVRRSPRKLSQQSSGGPSTQHSSATIRPVSISLGTVIGPTKHPRAKQPVVRPPFKPPGVTSVPRAEMQPGKIPPPSFQWRGQACVTSQTLQAASRITRSKVSTLLGTSAKESISSQTLQPTSRITRSKVSTLLDPSAKESASQGTTSKQTNGGQ